MLLKEGGSLGKEDLGQGGSHRVGEWPSPALSALATLSGSVRETEVWGGRVRLSTHKARGQSVTLRSHDPRAQNLGLPQEYPLGTYSPSQSRLSMQCLGHSYTKNYSVFI